MRPKTIVFIGFRHKVDSIKSARDAGYLTVLLTRKKLEGCEKYFDEIFEEDIFDVEILKDLVPILKKKYLVKGVVSNYEHYVVHRSFFAERFGIPSCSVYSACCTRNKAMQRHALHFMKENIDYAIVSGEEEAVAALNEMKGKIYLKSIAGIKSRFVFPLADEESIKKVFGLLKGSQASLDEDLYDDYEYCDFNFRYPDPKKYFLVEKAEYGQQVTVASLIGNHTIWHAPSICDVYTAGTLGRDDTFLAYRILPSKYEKETVLKAQRATETASRILGLKNCSVHAEYILREDGDLKLIELASRMGGYRARMYKETYELDLNQLLIQAVIGKEIKTRRAARKYISLMEIFPENEGIFNGIENLDVARADEAVSNIVEKKKVGDEVGLAKNGFEPVMNLQICGKTYKEVQEKSVEYQKLLKVKLK